MVKFRREECKKGSYDSVRCAGRSAARIFGALATATALALAAPGCSKPKEKEKSAEQLKTEKEAREDFVKLLNEKSGHATDVYDITYPEFFTEMLSSPFDKEDGISYGFAFKRVRQEDALDIVRGLKEALDAHYIESDVSLMRDDKVYRVSYKTELHSIHYDADKNGKGELEIYVKLERTEELVKKKGNAAHR